MPLDDLGYRAWQGRLTPQSWRFWVIAQTGLRLAWRNMWLRRMLLFAWLPAMYFATLLLVYEQVHADTPLGRTLIPWLEGVPLASDRHTVWASLLWIFFRYPQGILMVLVVGQIAPPLVAQDVRTKAFLLYFSRPLARFEYVLGKMAIVWAYLMLITTVPALALYVVGVLLSPELSVVWSTWDLPLRIVAASAVLMIPTTAVALAISSLTTETRYAAFGWFAFWAVGWAAYYMLLTHLPAAANPRRWSVVSMYHTLGTIEYWIFGLGGKLGGLLSTGPQAAILPSPSQVQLAPAVVQVTAITLVALVILFRRISSPMRI